MMIVITLQKEYVWKTITCCVYAVCPDTGRLQTTLSAVSESMDVDGCRGRSLRLTTAFILTLLQLHSVDPHQAKIERK